MVAKFIVFTFIYAAVSISFARAAFPNIQNDDAKTITHLVAMAVWLVILLIVS